MKNQLAPRNESREQRLLRIGRMAADETLRLYEQAKFQSNVVLGHTHQDLEIAVRLPSEEALRNGREILKRMDAGEDIRGMKAIFAFGAVNLQERFGQPSADGKPSNGSDPNTEGVQPIDGHRPIDIVPLHAIRIGDLALVTQPCELYCQFGLDIKRRSPTPLTAVVGLTDAYCGYCPTIAGVLGGGYSGQPISWTRLEKLAGYRMVEAAGPMLHSLWKKRSDASK